MLNQVASCQAEDVEMAVKAARRAFDSGVWSQRTPKERKRVMLRFAALFEQHMEELALLETLDMGKPISESAGFDVHAVLDCLQWYAESCDKLYDEVAPSGPSAVGLVTREAIGVVAAVTPWNFPMLMAMWKVAPALAMGNSVVLKPAEQSPLTALRIAQLAAEAGIPAGVFNVLPGFGPTAGKALGLHMDVDTLVFTGSGEVGKLFLQYAGQSNMKRVWLECGGKTPNIILDDCRDLEKAATTAARSMFFNQGEVCVAPSRLIVEAGIRAEFVAEVLKVARTIAVGDPLDPTTQLGAIVDASQLQRVLGYIDKGVQEGAQLILGGERVKHGLGAEGFYIPPTIFDNVSNDMTIAREEIFGPVLSVITARDHLDALRIANDTPYGLAASLWTPRPLAGPPNGPGPACRQRVGQLLRWGRHQHAVRWLQAVRQRSRPLVACPGQVFGAQVHLDRVVTFCLATLENNNMKKHSCPYPGHLRPCHAARRAGRR
ncbi:aldehyde dehydrogenase [Pseudomonas putida S11]|nr:aldehyde dehydrogenase [Pseudomonas putida S11]